MNAIRFRSFAGFLLVAAVTSICIRVPAASAERRAFRITSLGITDPQIFIPLTTACNGPLNVLINSVLNSTLGTCTRVNPETAEPCTFDLNLVAVFDPLDQTAGDGSDLVQCMSGGQPCELDFAVISECTRNAGVTTCDGEPSAVVSADYSNGGAALTCLGPHPGTFGANNNGIAPIPVPVTGTASNNCTVSGLIELILDVGDGSITIPLKGASLAARYSGNPATGLTNGLARGFLSEEAANSIMLDINESGIVINGPLSSVLPGGATNCKTSPPTPGIPQDDRDYNPPGDLNGERGWWFYLTFAATLVTVPEFPTPTATFTMVQGDTPTPTPPPTETPANTSTSTPLPTNTPTPTNSPVGASCAGDCDGNGMVPINEVQRVANIYLGTQELSGCPSADRNGDREVAINEVVLASRSYQFDCPVP